MHYQLSFSSSCYVILVCLLAYSIYFLRLNLREISDYKSSGQWIENLANDSTCLELLLLSDKRLSSDVYWLAFIQYIGNSEKKQTDVVYKLLDRTTSLDPQFVQPYYFAAFTLGSELKRPDLAQRLIERGIHANQNDWCLPFIAGINQYLFAHNEGAAANYYRLAAKFPDAPKWLGRQAEILQAKIPSLVKEVNTWDTIYRTSTDLLVKERAKERLAATWMRVFKVSSSEEIRKKARKALAELGVEVR